MAVVGAIYTQMLGSASGGPGFHHSFSLENLPGLDAIAFIAMYSMGVYLDSRGSGDQPLADGFFIDWSDAKGPAGNADPVFYGNIQGTRVTSINFGLSGTNAQARWTINVELFE